MVKRSRSRRALKRRETPTRMVWTGEEIVFQTQDVATVDYIYTNSSSETLRFSLRRGQISVTGGNFTTTAWFIIRRVPSGYNPPTSVTVATGSSTFIDGPDILAYGCTKIAPSAVQTMDWILLKPNCTLYKGDAVCVQAVPTGNSTDLKFSSMLEYLLVN